MLSSTASSTGEASSGRGRKGRSWRRWTEVEDAVLRAALQEHRSNWNRIYERMLSRNVRPPRTIKQVRAPVVLWRQPCIRARVTLWCQPCVRSYVTLVYSRPAAGPLQRPEEPGPPERDGLDAGQRRLSPRGPTALHGCHPLSRSECLAAPATTRSLPRRARARALASASAHAHRGTLMPLHCIMINFAFACRGP
jgi:hypothetical protein